MLNDIFKFLSPTKPSKTSKKPLAIRTIYSSGSHPTLLDKPDVSISNVKKNAPVTEEVFVKQKRALECNPLHKDAVIEVVTLPEDTVLVGLTKHPQPILGGVMMYPANICYSESWKTIEDEASERHSGIAVFKLSQSVECLKVTSSKVSTTPSYLVDHRTIYREKWLSHPSQREANSDSQKNHNSLGR